MLLFIVYFIIDNMGYKMARDGKLEVWLGIWLSTLALLPLGVFFTYKAVGDSAVFNIDAYRNFFNRLRGKHLERSLTLKEVRMTEVEPATAADMAREFLDLVTAEQKRLGTLRPLARRFSRTTAATLRDPLNRLVDYLSNSPDIYTINILNQYPFTPGPRNIGDVERNTRALLDRLGANPDNNNPRNYGPEN